MLTSDRVSPVFASTTKPSICPLVLAEDCKEKIKRKKTIIERRWTKIKKKFLFVSLN
jgi:hypothetical protein